MDNAEIGEHRFLRTGDARDLAQYRAAVAAVPRLVKQLEELTSDNADHRTRLGEIKRLTGERLGTLKLSMELRASAGADAALAAIRSNEGLQQMENLRSILDAVIDEENGLLVKRTAQAETQFLRGRWVLGLGSER